LRYKKWKFVIANLGLLKNKAKQALQLQFLFIEKRNNMVVAVQNGSLIIFVAAGFSLRFTILRTLKNATT